MTEPKPRRCKNKLCRVKFIPPRPFVQWCSPECGAVIAEAKIARAKALKLKKERSDYRAAKERIKTRGDYAKDAQIAINAYRREVTRHLGCISCGTHTGQMQGGHYRSVGAYPEKRYIENNIWAQCSRCNTRLSGNLINYRINLVKLIGNDEVEKLESNTEAQHYTIEQLKELKRVYAEKLKTLIKCENS